VSEANSNYANLITIYDRLLGTDTPADRAASVVYGLDAADAMRTASCTRLLWIPFGGDRGLVRPADTKIRIEASAGR